MKESELRSTLAMVNKTIDDLCSARDGLTAEIRKALADRSELEAKLQLLAMPPSPIRAQVLEAAGIESEEKFGNG